MDRNRKHCHTMPWEGFAIFSHFFLWISVKVLIGVVIIKTGLFCICCGLFIKLVSIGVKSFCHFLHASSHCNKNRSGRLKSEKQANVRLLASMYYLLKILPVCLFQQKGFKVFVTLLDLGLKLNSKTWRVDNLSTLGEIRLVFLQFLSKLLNFFWWKLTSN